MQPERASEQRRGRPRARRAQRACEGAVARPPRARAVRPFVGWDRCRLCPSLPPSSLARALARAASSACSSVDRGRTVEPAAATRRKFPAKSVEARGSPLKAATGARRSQRQSPTIISGIDRARTLNDRSPRQHPPPTDVCLLLRAHAEQRWLSREVHPLLPSSGTAAALPTGSSARRSPTWRRLDRGLPARARERRGARRAPDAGGRATGQPARRRRAPTTAPCARCASASPTASPL